MLQMGYFNPPSTNPCKPHWLTTHPHAYGNERVNVDLLPWKLCCKKKPSKGLKRRCCGVLEYSLDSRAEGPGSSLTIATALLSFSKAIYPHCCSRPRCINREPGRMWQMIVFEFASTIITGCYTRQGILPGEWKLCTVSAALKCIQWPG